MTDVRELLGESVTILEEHKASTGVVFEPDPRKPQPIDTYKENGFLVTKMTDGTFRKTRIPE